MMRTPARRAAARQAPRHPRAPRTRAAAVLVAAAASLLATAACGVRPAPAARPARTHTAATAATGPAGVAALPLIVPRPVSMTPGRGRYVLTRQTRIVAPGSPPALAVARDLAGYLWPATGYPLPVVTGAPAAGDITLVLGSQAGLRTDPYGEAYRIDVTPAGARLAADTAHGLYDAVQTFRQALPPWISERWRRPSPWPVPRCGSPTTRGTATAA